MDDEVDDDGKIIDNDGRDRLEEDDDAGNSDGCNDDCDDDDDDDDVKSS